MFTYIPSLLRLLPTASHFTPRGHHRAPRSSQGAKGITGRRGHHTAPSWAHWAIRQFPTSYLFCTWECIYVSATLWIHPTLSFLPYVHKSILYVCISDVALLSWESSECIALFTSIFPWNCSESLPISMAVWAKPFQPLSPPIRMPGNTEQSSLCSTQDLLVIHFKYSSVYNPSLPP